MLVIGKCEEEAGPVGAQTRIERHLIHLSGHRGRMNADTRGLCV